MGRWNGPMLNGHLLELFITLEIFCGIYNGFVANLFSFLAETSASFWALKNT
jgi:hypothetical protein